MNRQRRLGFTLIELLVVIAIIAILAAILFPVFAQAKLAAKKTAAISNIKQVTLGTVIYSGDVDDMMMPKLRLGYGPGNGGDPEVAMTWDKLVQPYIKSYPLMMSGEDTGTKYDSPYGKVRRSFSMANNAFRGVQINSAWAAANWGTSNTQQWADSNSATSFPLPSETVAFGEKHLQVLSNDTANAWKTADWQNGVKFDHTRMDSMPASDPRAQYGEIANRYNGGSVWSYVDGHAAFLRAGGRAGDGVLHGTILKGYHIGTWAQASDSYWDQGISCTNYGWFRGDGGCPVPGEQQ